MSIDWYVHGFETDNYAQELSEAIIATGNRIHLLKRPSFSRELPQAPTGSFVLYGGTRMIEAAVKTPGWEKSVWFDLKRSSWDACEFHWRGNMLMDDFYISTIDDLVFFHIQIKSLCGLTVI